LTSHLIADKNDIRAEWLAGAGRVGVTAGASTPEFLVSDVVEELRCRHGARVREVLSSRPFRQVLEVFIGSSWLGCSGRAVDVDGPADGPRCGSGRSTASV
jgi:hypothetical protein